jgi:hypothetical protein
MLDREFAWTGNNPDDYRAPDISEFVSGFKYEVWSEGYYEDSVEDFCGWYEYEVGKDWRDMGDYAYELKQENIRVLVCPPK